jgi:hypothetical protein
MESTAARRASPGGPAHEDKFGAGQLFLTDSRLAFELVNSARYALLRSAFGMSREQANIVTVVGALVAADAAYETARRFVRSPFGVTRADVVLGGFAMREAAFGVTGPGSREIPLFGTLVAGAVVAGLAFPGIRRAARRLRASEQQLRQQRISTYQAVRRRVSADD